MVIVPNRRKAFQGDFTAYFNGTDQYADLSTYANAIPSGDTTWSVNVWVKRANTSNHGLFYESTSSGNTFTKFVFECVGTGLMAGYRSSPSGSFTSFGTHGSVVTANEWHMCTVTVESGAQKFYVDAVEVGTDNESVSGISASSASNDKHFFAGQVSSGSSSAWKYFEGSGCLPQLFNVALTSTEVSELYNSGNPKLYADLSAGLKTDTDSAWNVIKGKPALGEEFDDQKGSLDFTNIGSINFTGSSITLG